MHCERTLPRHREVGNGSGAAATLDTLGYAHQHLGDHARAATHYRRAIEAWRRVGDLYCEAEATVHLGDCQHAAGAGAEARESWRAALAILEGIGHADADAVRAKLTG